MSTKYLIIGSLFIGFLLGGLTHYSAFDETYKSSKTLQDFEAREAKKDTTIKIYQEVVTKLGNENKELSLKNETLIGITDTLMMHIQQLSKPVVTKRDKAEVLDWVNSYNSTVKE